MIWTDINDIAIDNLNNVRNQGTADFKQIDIAKQKEKLEQLKNARLAEGVDYRTKEGREIGNAIKEIEEQIKTQDKMKLKRQIVVTMLDPFAI